MIDLNTLSKSYPYLSLARKLSLDYGDVLIISDLYTPTQIHVPFEGTLAAAMKRVGQPNCTEICHVAAAIANGEIGHGN